MHRAVDSRGISLRSGRVAAVGLAIVALGVMAAFWWIGSNSAPQGAAAVDASAGIALWSVAFAWLGLALALALAAAFAGASLARYRMADALREARMDRQSLSALLDVWQWHTDREHRLTHSTPPQAAPAAAWSQTGTRLPLLWERFESEASAPNAMRERVCARTTFHDVPVSQREADGSVTKWLLRGVPRFDVTGSFAGYVGTARPLQPMNETRLLRSVLAAMPGPIVVGIIAPEGVCRVAHANAAARELLGADSTGWAWDDMLARLPTQLAGAAREACAGALSPEGSQGQAEGWALHMRNVASSDAAQVLRVLALTPAGSAGEAADVDPTDHESFSYTVSHDLRAPIRVVEGFARILKEDYAGVLDKVGVDHLDRVLGAASRMNSMIDALLELSQLSAQPLARQPVNLTQLAGYVIEDLRRGSPQREVAVHIQPGMLAQGDPTLLRIALENLLGNAWKYSEKVTEPQIWFETMQHDGATAYTVRDNGAGFDMRFADRLFGVFQRLHSASDFEGTGVGLASVQRIVRRHRGHIWAESEIGRGASFHFTLRA